MPTFTPLAQAGQPTLKPSSSFNPTPSAPAQQTNPDAFKALIVSKYPKGVASDGTKYADMSAQDLTQKIVSKYPNGVTNDGRKYSDFLGPQPATPPAPIGAFGKGSYFGDAIQAGKDYLGSVKSQWDAGQQMIDQPFQQKATQGPLGAGGAAAGALHVGAGLGTKIFSPAAPLFNILGAGINAVGNFVSDPTLGGKNNNPTAQAHKASIENFAASPTGKKVAEGAQVVSDAAQVAGMISPIKEGFTSMGGALSDLATKDARFGGISPSAPSGASDAIINNYYSRAVKPSISGKTTAADTAAYQAKTSQAVNTIVQNKSNLSLVTEEGTKETGRLPQNLNEFSQSIDQTKKSIYSQYDALARQSGDKGITVNPKGITNELKPVIESEALQLTHPEAIEYAQKVSDRYANAKPLDPKVTQDVIENYNAELQAFYRNPTYNMASRVAIDAAVVRHFRTALDEVISKATGEKYQALRNQYAALKTIEADVTKAANRVARLNNKGLADYTDIFSGGDIAAGLLTLNPALFAKGIAQHGIKNWIKSFNSPDKAISNMFSKADTGLPTKPPAINTNSTTANPPQKPTSPLLTPKSLPSTKPTTGILEKAKQSFQDIKKKGNRGFIKLPLSKKIPQQDLATMSDFTDYAAKNPTYKLKGEAASSMEQEAADLWDKYLSKGGTRPKTIQGLASDFGRALEASNFGKGQGRDTQGRYTNK